METLADILRTNNVYVKENVPGMVWSLIEGEPEKEQQAPRPGLFNFWRREKEEKPKSDAKKFTCWTCGDELEAIDFLRHIKVCCKD